MKIAIIGGSNGGYAAAADLTIKGHDIYFWQRSKEVTNKLIINNNHIFMHDNNGKQKVKIYKICKSLKSAIINCEIIIILLPAFSQKNISTKILPFLKNNQIVFLPPGSFGSWLFINNLKNKNIFFAETGTLPYLTRKKNNFTVSITTKASQLPTGVYPISKRRIIINKLKKVYPSVKYCGDILSAALMNAGPIIHPPLVLLNTGAIEHFAKWDIHNEGTQNSVKKIIFALDNERIQIRKKLKYKGPHFPIKDHYKNGGKNWMYGNLAHDKLVASKNWRENINLYSHRYIIEDIHVHILKGLV